VRRKKKGKKGKQVKRLRCKTLNPEP